MPQNTFNQDLRSRKTRKSLTDATYVLLNKKNFRKITTKDICDEALISRATFYAHFIDKYDFLKHWLIDWQPNCFNKNDTYETLEKSINQFINQNKRIIKNIIENADQETMDIVFDTILLYFSLDTGKNCKEIINQKYIVFSNIFAGGIIYYLLWHIENRFPLEVMNIYLYSLINEFRAWASQ